MLFQRSNIQRSQGVPDCSLCDILLISRNLFIIFSILVLTDMTQHIFGGPKISDSLANYFVVLCPTYHENVIEIRSPIFL